MRLVLDIHLLLWSWIEPDRLSALVRELLADDANEVFVSSAALLEIATKLNAGKLWIRPNLTAWVPDALRSFGYQVLPVNLEHVLAVEQLPLHHRDPFDRLLIAQARLEGLTVVTADRRFRAYDVPVLW